VDSWLSSRYPALVLDFEDVLQAQRIETREAVLWSSAVHLLPHLERVERVLLVQPALAFHDDVVPERVLAMRDRIEACDWRVVDAFARQAFPGNPMASFFSEHAMTIAPSKLAFGLEQLTKPFTWDPRWSSLCSVLVSRRDRICSAAGLLRFFAQHGSRGVHIVDGDIHGPGDLSLDALVRAFWS
jgi:hypothetical protein